MNTNEYVNLGIINPNNLLNNGSYGQIDILFNNVTGTKFTLDTPILTNTTRNIDFGVNGDNYLAVNNVSSITGTTTCTDYFTNGEPNEYALFRIKQNSVSNSTILFRPSDSTTANYYEWPVGEQPFTFNTDSFKLDSCNNAPIVKVVICPPFGTPIELIPKNDNNGYHILYDATNNIQYAIQQ